MLNLPATTTKTEYIRCEGGMNQLAPTLAMKPGSPRDSLNFEASIAGGYTRIAGYERFDGRPAPTSATYRTLTLNVTGSLAVGDTITGAVSGATGRVIYRGAAGMVAFTRETGEFQSGEGITVSGTPVATVTGLGGFEARPDFDVDMLDLAMAVYRADIGPVPGSGPVRGVIYWKGELYAARNNSGATALVLHRATSGGWTAITLPRTVSFTAGSAAYADGGTLTQGGVSATILRVVLESGSWGSSTAAGRLIIGAPTGGNFAAGAAAGTGAATLSGAQTQITLAPNGTVDWETGSIGAASRVYAVDGVNPFAWEFDGTTLVPVGPGGGIVPKRVMVHMGHLFIAYDDLVRCSGVGTPYNWTSIAGSVEFRVDSPVTAMQRLAGNQDAGAAAVYQEDGLSILYGTSALDFKLVPYEDAAGAKPRTVQRLGEMFALDDRGVVALAATNAYSNWDTSALTFAIRPWMQQRRNLATGSLVNREKSQYRLFFSDGSGVYVTVANGKLLGAMPVQFAHAVTVCCRGDTPTGLEAAFFGSTDGYVYRLDSGPSHDGQPIEYRLDFPAATMRNPRQRKRWRAASFEIEGGSYAEWRVGHTQGYGSEYVAQEEMDVAAALSLSPTTYWDAFTWDAFTWDGRNLLPAEVELNGSADNIALLVTGRSAKFMPFTINSILVDYSPRRTTRRGR